MFDVSFTELMVIGVIALIVIGPERLPKVARTVGHLLGRAQRYVNDVKGDIQREIELDELRKFKSEMDDAAHSVKTSLRDTENSIRSSAQDARDGISDLKKAVEAPAAATSDSSATSSGAPAPTGEATTDSAASPADTASPGATVASSSTAPVSTDATAAPAAAPGTTPQSNTSTTP